MLKTHEVVYSIRRLQSMELAEYNGKYLGALTTHIPYPYLCVQCGAQIESVTADMQTGQIIICHEDPTHADCTLN